MPTNNIAEFRGDLRDWILDTSLPELADVTTFTLTSPSSATLNAAGHGLANGTEGYVASTGTKPLGLSADASYFVVEATTDTFELSLSEGGGGAVPSTTGSGTLTFATGSELNLTRRAAALALADRIGSRLYWGRKPQSTTLPLVVLRMVSHDSPLTFSRPQEIMTTRVQADIHAASGADMDAVRDALVARLHDLEGVTQGTTTLLSIAADNQIDDFSEAADNWLASVDFLVRHKQTV